MHLQYTKIVPQFLPRNSCQVRTIVQPSPQKNHLEKCSNSILYGLSCTVQQQEKHSSQKSCQILPRFLWPLPLVVRIVWIHTVQHPIVKRSLNTQTKMFPWDFFPKYLGKCALFASLISLSQVYSQISLNILLLCLSH
jgi:hypothetical protein